MRILQNPLDVRLLECRGRQPGAAEPRQAPRQRADPQPEEHLGGHQRPEGPEFARPQGLLNVWNRKGTMECLIAYATHPAPSPHALEEPIPADHFQMGSPLTLLLAEYFTFPNGLRHIKRCFQETLPNAQSISDFQMGSPLTLHFAEYITQENGLNAVESIQHLERHTGKWIGDASFLLSGKTASMGL